VSAVDREKVLRTEGLNQRRKRTSAIKPTARMGRAAWAGLWACMEQSKSLSRKAKDIAFLFKATKKSEKISKTKKTSKYDKREVFN
jgi:hypothetical protein